MGGACRSVCSGRGCRGECVVDGVSKGGYGRRGLQESLQQGRGLKGWVQCGLGPKE